MADTQYDAARRSKRAQPAPIPTVPDSLIWVVRIGGMVALACAAAISAQTLFRLGRLLGFPPETAWLLPAALDVCAGVCIWTAATIPVGHPGRQRAAIYATLALLFTVISNVLYHAITLGQWTWQDDSLMGVSAIPPIVVEILLHLQTVVTNDHATANAPAVADRGERQQAAGKRIPERQEQPPLTVANANNATVNDSAKTANADDSGTGNATGNKRRSDPEWTAIAKSVYIDVRDELGKRPPEGPFHTALVAELRRLAAPAELPAADLPSPGTSKRVRGLVEAAFPDLAALIHPVAS